MSRYKRRTRYYRRERLKLELFVTKMAQRLSDEDEDLAQDLEQEGRIGAWFRADVPARTRVERSRRMRRAAVNRMMRFLARDALDAPELSQLEKLARASDIGRAKRVRRRIAGAPRDVISRRGMPPLLDPWDNGR